MHEYALARRSRLHPPVLAAHGDNDLIDDIYEAALLPDRWPGVLARLGDEVGTMGGLLFTNSAEGTRWLGGGGAADMMRDFVAQGWMAHNNDRLSRLIATGHPGFVADLDLLSEEEALLPMYQDFLVPRGCAAAAGTYVAGLDADALILSVEGFADRAAVHAAIPYLDTLRPHLARAAQLSSQFLLERLRSQVSALEAIGVAACVVSGTGTLRAANQRFEAELGHVAFDMRTGVHVADKDADRLLARALEALRRDEFSGCSIALRDGEAGASRVLHLLPIKGEASDLFVRASALLVISDPRKLIQVSNGLLHSLFDLTPAEARLASRLCRPDSALKEIAAEHGVSLSTVQSQLKSVLAKTGAAGQVDLVRLLLGAATL